MKINKFIAAILAAGAALSASACSEVNSGNSNGASGGSTNNGGVNGDTYVLKVGETQGALCHAPLQAAMELGFLDDEGINWERVDFGGGAIQAALGAGTIDCGFGL